MLIELFSVIISFVILFFIIQGDLGFGQVLMNYLDIPSLICILFLVLPILARNGLWKDFVCAFKMQKKAYTCGLSQMKRSLDAVELMQKQVLYAGLIVTIVPIIYILGIPEPADWFNANVAVALIPVLYAAILELFLLPLQLEVKKRIILYMEEE